MITGINESKTLRKHIANSNQWWKNNKCWCECKKRHVYKKDYICNPGTCICENGKDLASITDVLAITCDETTETNDEETETMPTNFNKNCNL